MSATPSTDQPAKATPYRAIAFSGSLRAGSTNTALVHLAVRLARERQPEDLTVEIIDWVDQLPWMNPDLEDAPPEIVQRWWAALRSADALIIGMPEYNFTPTALAKNTLDWATRPPTDRAIAGTHVVFLSSAGRGGGGRSQDSVTTILGFMGATVVEEPQVRLVMVGDRFDADGGTNDPEIIAAVSAKLDALVSALAARDAAVAAAAADGDQPTTTV